MISGGLRFSRRRRRFEYGIRNFAQYFDPVARGRIFRGRVSGFYGLTGGGLREFGGMQAGFVAEWAGAPFAIGAGALVLALLGYFFLGSRLNSAVEQEA